MSTRARTPLLLVLLSMLLAPGSGEAQGILLLAHGGRDDWNRKVLELAAQVDSTRPVEVAFGMANKRTIQDALHRLEQRDVTDVVAVPLFVSSHSSVFRATEYLLGSREDAPPQLEAFARMAARRGGGGTASDPDFEWTTPVETALPISVTTALDGHALVAEILLSRAADVSRTPEDEVVVLVAHGPSSAEDNVLWLANMSTLVEQMRPRTRFSRIEHLTVRDDASEPIRNEATAELRAVVEAVVEEGKSALIVPLLLSYGGIEAGIRERLEGLSYRMAEQALLPDERLSEWVLMQAMERRRQPPDLVDAVASFGAVGHDGALYVGDQVLGVGGSSRAGHLAAIDVAPMRQAPRDSAAPEQGARRWPGFLGGRDTNVSRAARLPLTWSDDSVAWRVTTPGFGQSSPVIWDDAVFLTALEGAMKETLFITAIDLEDGSERWRRTFGAAEAFEWNDYVSKGAPTPAVDAERLYAFFDSGDLLALTHDGQGEQQPAGGCRTTCCSPRGRWGRYRSARPAACTSTRRPSASG